MNRAFRTHVARAFTLVELLTVIAIITLLLAILLPVAGRVRIQAQTAQTWSSLAAIGGAIERYQQFEHAFPGLYTNAQLAAGASPTFTPAVTGAGNKVTMTENVVASLIGGFDPTGASPPGVVVNVNNVGKGPMNFSPSVVKQTRGESYLPGAQGTLLPSAPYTSTGCAAINTDTPGTAPGTKDSGIPEFYDNYSQRRPFIILRANPGVAATTAGNIVGNNTAQYTVTAEFGFYKRGPSGDFAGDFRFGSGTVLDVTFYGSETEYIRNPNSTNIARGFDRFIIVSAGPDRVFGTRDDIFYGGGQ